MVKHGTMRGSRAAAAPAVAGIVVAEGWMAGADEEALVAPEVGAFGAALIAALTLGWLLLRLQWRRGAAVAPRAHTACWPGELRLWGARDRRRPLSRCASRRRPRDPLWHAKRRRLL